jgi:hypothetical protein
MNRFIRTERLRTSDANPPDRELSTRFGTNLKEWLDFFVSDAVEADNIRREAKRLQHVRNNIAHNIWMLRLDTQLGAVVNIVQENEDFYREEAEWRDDQRTKGKRAQKPQPDQFLTDTYFEADLIKAANDMLKLSAAMRLAETASYAKRYPPESWRPTRPPLSRPTDDPSPSQE